MAGMIETIKKASIGAMNASNPLDIEFGTIMAIDNLTIKIDQKRILPKEFFIVPDHLTRYVINLEHSHTYTDGSTGLNLGEIVVREGLKIGDVVALLRIENGSRFLVLDKVVA